jgi:hypothetical protein
MLPEDLSALTDDIAVNGLRHPIVLFEGQVLDGWHRLTACGAAGLPPVFVEFDGDDPVAFVTSLNLARRHLSGSQRAAAIVACRDWRPSGVNQLARSSAAAAEDAPSAKALAVEAGVSPRTIEHAKAAQRGGAGELVRDGKVSAEKGAAIAKLPPKERKKAIANPEKWAEKLERKPAVPKGDQLRQELEPEAPEAEDAGDVLADLEADLLAATRIIEADDKLSAAWDECKTLTRKLEQLDGLYKATCAELATMTQEAKRWKRKAESLEKGRAA